MAHFSPEQLRSGMKKRNNIRNVAVIGQTSHGKTSLIDSLVAAAGLIPAHRVGEHRFTDTRSDEQLRCHSIKSTCVSMCFDLKPSIELPIDHDGRDCLISLIDAPGLADFSAEMNAAIRLSDGALVVVDCVEGVCMQTDKGLRQALCEKVKPVLAITKLDRALIEMQLEPEVLYTIIAENIESFNKVIRDSEEAAWEVSPTKGSVCFCSGLYGWGFTLNHFASLYATKFGVPKEKMVTKLWGDNYFDPKSKKWTTSPVGVEGDALSRGFCQFVLQPIYKICNAVLNKDTQELHKILDILKLTLTEEEECRVGKPLLKTIMRKFCSLADALLELCVLHLPSPVTAQGYRVSSLYDGRMDDEYGQAIRTCDPEGPLMIYIAKMQLLDPEDHNNNGDRRFLAIGRIFSGKIHKGKEVAMLGPQFSPGKRDDLKVKRMPGVVTLLGRSVDTLEDDKDCYTCGNVIGLVGIDDDVTHGWTIAEDKSAFKLKKVRNSVPALIRVTLEPMDTQNLPRLKEGLKRLSKSDNSVGVVDFSDQSVDLFVMGELHMEICLQDLKEIYISRGTEFTISEPIFQYRETVDMKSDRACLAKTPNKHNRFYVSAEPIHDELSQAIENGVIDIRNSELVNVRARARYIAEKYDWDPTDARRIWAFGTNEDNSAANVFVDTTFGVQYLIEVKDSAISGFSAAVSEGPLCAEPMRGVRIDLQDVVIHVNGIHRTGVIPTVRRVIYGSFLTANPRLAEAIYYTEIYCQEPHEVFYDLLNRRRGHVIEVDIRANRNNTLLKCFVPISESSGFLSEVRVISGGTAFAQMIFSHWEALRGDPLDATTHAGQVVAAIRKRKGLAPDIPPFDYYLERL